MVNYTYLIDSSIQIVIFHLTSVSIYFRTQQFRRLIPLNLKKCVHNTDISNEDKSKSSSDLPAQNSFTQEPKISKCGNKFKCKNSGFRKNPVLQVNIQSEYEEQVGRLYSKNYILNNYFHYKSKSPKKVPSHECTYKTFYMKLFLNILYESK